MTLRTVHLGSGLTADEYIALDDEVGELIRGEIRPKPMPGPLHAQLCIWLGILLARILDRRRIYSDLDLKMSEADVLRPDICILRAPWPDPGPVTEPPVLCIEVLSPSQGRGELFDKCELFHAFGVPYCWVIDSRSQRAWEYHRAQSPVEKHDELTAGEIAISLAELFETGEPAR